MGMREGLRKDGGEREKEGEFTGVRKAKEEKRVREKEEEHRNRKKRS
jgi:hypothetical protein